MNLLNKIFISIAKLYVVFYSKEQDQWRYFTTLLIALIIAFNLMTLSFFIIDIPVYYYILVFFIVAFILYFKFEKISYDDVIMNEINLKKRLVIYFLILLNFIAIFVVLNYFRNNTFSE
jgi:hypothetical protein